MPNPVFVDCPPSIWTKVATNVLTGVIHRFDVTPYGYLQTYKVTGDSAPTLKSDGVAAFKNCNQEQISAGAGIDVYIYAITDKGKVRIDV